MHIPNILNIFDYTPKGFLPFNLFIDSYEEERKNRALVSLNSNVLLECLHRKFPERFLLKNRGKIDLYRVLNLIMSAIFSEGLLSLDMMNHNDVNLLAFHPEWQVIIDSKNDTDFEKYISKATSLIDLPKGLLITYRWLLNDKKKRVTNRLKPKKNLFFRNYFYQLDAFIEYREDENFSGSYITYLKKEDVWYQCEDAKVKKINPKNLCMALFRSVLLHYRLVHKNFNSRLKRV